METIEFLERIRILKGLILEEEYKKWDAYEWGGMRAYEWFADTQKVYMIQINTYLLAMQNRNKNQ